MNIFLIRTIGGEILNIEKMNWSNDLGHIYTLREAVAIVQGGENYHENPHPYGKKEYLDNRDVPLVMRNKDVIEYMVEADRWSVALLLVENLLMAKA
jgi:hypothetical protein